MKPSPATLCDIHRKHSLLQDRERHRQRMQEQDRRLERRRQVALVNAMAQRIRAEIHLRSAFDAAETERVIARNVEAGLLALAAADVLDQLQRNARRKGERTWT